MFQFPNPVTEVSARLVAAGVVVMGVVQLVADWRWLSVVLVYGFLARVMSGPTLSPLGQVATRVVTPTLSRVMSWEPKLVAGPPKRFAQAMGLTFSGAALGLTFAGESTAARVVYTLLVAAATLESAFGYCLGCKVFALLMRVGIIPTEVCESCNDIWAARGEPATVVASV